MLKSNEHPLGSDKLEAHNILFLQELLVKSSFFLVFHRISSFFVSCYIFCTAGILSVLLAKFEVFLMELTTTTFFSTVPKQVLQDLRQLNVLVHLSGYRCLCVAILKFSQDISQTMCSELYPAVAKELGYMDWRAVEFAIRRSILWAWNHGSREVWETYFPGAVKAPSNKHFIAVLAQRIK